MHPVKAVPTRCNPFVHGEKPKKTHSSIKPIKTKKKPAGLGFFFKKTRVFLNPASYYTETLLYSNFRGPLFLRTCQAREIREIKGTRKKTGFYSRSKILAKTSLHR